MDPEVIEQIIDVVVRLGILIVTGLLIPFLKSKIDNAKLQRTINTIEIVVKSVEQMLPDFSGEEKLEYVIKTLQYMGIEVGRYERAIIESIVYQLEPSNNKEDPKLDSLNS